MTLPYPKIGFLNLSISNMFCIQGFAVFCVQIRLTLTSSRKGYLVQCGDTSDRDQNIYISLQKFCSSLRQASQMTS